MSHRSQTLPEEVVNAITHGIGVVFTFTLIAIPILWEKSSEISGYYATLGIIAFGLGMLAVYLSSTLLALSFLNSAIMRSTSSIGKVSKLATIVGSMPFCQRLRTFFLRSFSTPLSLPRR
jgi:channel protein (hemolysin III family)